MLEKQPSGRRWANPATTAQYVGKSQGRLAKLRHYGGGPPYAKAGRSVIYDLDDVDRWLEGQKRHSTSEESAANRHAERSSRSE